MKQIKNNNQEIGKALELLPWYSVGLLSKKDHTYVERMLNKHPELQEDLTLDIFLSERLKETEQPLDLSSLPSIDKRLRRVLGQLDINSIAETKNTNSFLSQAKHFWANLFSGDSSKLQYIATATASIALVALVYAFISPLIFEENTFHPAAENSSVINKNPDITVLLVGLSTDSSNPRLQKLLEDIATSKLSVISGEDGMYRLSLSKKLTPAETKALIKKLASQKDLVWFAGEAY